jgi:hypothetical protein
MRLREEGDGARGKPSDIDFSGNEGRFFVRDKWTVGEETLSSKNEADRGDDVGVPSGAAHWGWSIHHVLYVSVLRTEDHGGGCCASWRMSCGYVAVRGFVALVNVNPVL